jgi:hypothetical protein
VGTQRWELFLFFSFGCGKPSRLEKMLFAGMHSAATT